MNQLVIRNADTGGIAQMSKEQYDMLYAPRGWEPVAIDVDYASKVMGFPVNDLSELDPDQVQKIVTAYDAQKPSVKKATLLEHKHDELVDMAKTAGLSAGGSKEEIADRILAAEPS